MLMNKKLSFLIALAALVAGISCNKVGDLEKRADTLEGSTIPSVAEQVERINASIPALTEAESGLKTKIKAVENGSIKESDLDAMKAADNALSQRIDKIRNSTSLYATYDWVTATFATLDQFNETCDDLAAVKQTVEKIVSDTDGKIADAVEACEEYMKDWIGDLFIFYNTAAETDVKIVALSAEIDSFKTIQPTLAPDIAQLKADLKEERDSLDKAKVELTAAYKAAIRTAIEKCNGRIDTLGIKVEKAIADINSIKSALPILENRASSLEIRIEALKEMVQSIEFIPEDKSGFAVFNPASGLKLTFAISPASAASAVVEAFLADSSAVTAEWKCVYAFVTKAETVSTFKIKEISLKDEERGTITVTIDRESLDAPEISAILNSRSEALAISLHITTGATDIRSEYISVIQPSTAI